MASRTHEVLSLQTRSEEPTITHIMNKTVLITGASRGIGRELARICAQKGHDLVLVARTKTDLEHLAKELETNYHITTLTLVKDLSKKSEILSVFEEVQSRNITIEYLVNNAGFGDYGKFADSNIERQYDMIELNIGALTLLTRLFVPGMIKNKFGRVMNLSSVAAYQSLPRMSVYAATKAYVLSFSVTINTELMGTGVRVSALCPGYTASNFQEAANLKTPPMLMKLLPSAKQVATYGYKVMTKGKPIAVHGIGNKLFTILMNITPKPLTAFIAGLIMARV